MKKKRKKRELCGNGEAPVLNSSMKLTVRGTHFRKGALAKRAHLSERQISVKIGMSGCYDGHHWEFVSEMGEAVESAGLATTLDR